MTGGVFFTWRGAVLASDLKAPTRHVLLTLACHMNDIGESCFPSIDLLTAETGLGRRTVVRHLNEARDAGWIVVKKHGFGGQKWARNEYVISWPDGVGAGGVSADMPGPGAGRQDGEGSARAAPPSEKGSATVAPPLPEGSATDDRKVVPERHSSTPVSTPRAAADAPPGQFVIKDKPKLWAARSAREIITTFDGERRLAFGAAQARPWPHALDFTTALDWHKRGATGEQLAALFAERMARLAADGQAPPETLKYFNKAVDDLLRGGNDGAATGGAARKRKSGHTSLIDAARGLVGRKKLGGADGG